MSSRSAPPGASPASKTVTLDEQIAAREAKGFEIVQQGRVLEPGRPGLTFADRVEGCNAGAIGSGDALLDDLERWVHMRRRPRG